ncbi:MAG: hypothetical protein HQL18_03360, partial [Candidatus Omnitrophica bacterium]|nr:hypothetical protein [Candidatus Omnitrophota bacterium]
MVLLLAFLANTLLPAPALAQVIVPALPALASPNFAPTLLKGVIVDAKDPYRFEFIVDKGSAEKSAVSSQQSADLKSISQRLIKYFLAALTTPENDLWVNLSPLEKDRIVAPAFGQTTMGRDLLAQDYLLKQITASLLHPDSDTGKKFWAEVYQKAHEKFGTIDIPVDAFNKVWISPDKARIYTNGNKAYIVSCRM